MYINSFVCFHCYTTIIKSQSQDLEFFVAEVTFFSKMNSFIFSWISQAVFYSASICTVFKEHFYVQKTAKTGETLKMLCGDRGTQNIEWGRRGGGGKGEGEGEGRGGGGDTFSPSPASYLYPGKGQSC